MVEEKLICKIHNREYHQVFNDKAFIIYECPICRSKNRIVDFKKQEVEV